MMRTRNSNRRKADSFRKIAVALLLAYFAMGAGTADAFILCLGEDGHRAIESAAACGYCGVRSGLPAQQEYMSPEGILSSGDACGLCRDYSVSSGNMVSGVSVPSSPGSAKGRVPLLHMACFEGAWSLIPLAQSLSGPPDPPDPTAIHTRPVVLLI
ncbi:MAG: hypothetical protein M1377_08175 [Deltaproteobacteria bacterium]|nr:hypothetical protein [Deltaproteobacteria bacterium]